MAKGEGSAGRAGQQAPARAPVGPVNEPQVALANWLTENGRPGPYWNTSEAQNDFVFESFLAPYAFVRRKSDNVRGTLTWADGSSVGVGGGRLYFRFEPR
jgi:hypothetical protein